MKMRSAFTLLEVLLAISLSSMIMLGTMQLYQGVVRYLEYSRDAMSTNRKVCLLFHQLERDLSAAYIPHLAKPEKTDDQKQTDQKEVPDQKKQDEEEKKKEQEQLKTFFIASIDERADYGKSENKKLEAFKQVNFITTNALQVYQEKRLRLVRVLYEIVKDKAKSTRELTSYQLVRKETPDLTNVQCKTDDTGAPAGRDKAVRKYVVADDIKAFFIEYSAKKKDLKKKEDKKEEVKEDEQEANKIVTSFQWGHRPEMQGIVPKTAAIWIDFWNDTKTKTSRFHASFPIMSYPTSQEKDKEKDKKKDDTQDSLDQQKLLDAGKTPDQTQQEEQT